MDYSLSGLIARTLDGQPNSSNFIGPYDANALFSTLDPDSQLLDLTMTPDVKDYLPSMFEMGKSKQFLIQAPVLAENGKLITYIERIQGFPVGMLFLTPPSTNRLNGKGAIWDISFFVLNTFRRKGYMGAALGRMLMIAKQNIGINKLYAFVDETNYVARNLLEQYAFDRQPYADNVAKGQVTYCCNLAFLQFQHA